MELSGKYSISTLCEEMGINRSGFYKWMDRLNKPSTKEQKRALYIELFTLYHNTYPSHGYRWLNAKIKLDLGESISNTFAHKICKYAQIKSISRHIVKSNKGKKELKDFPNLVLKNMHIDKPFMVVVSDMTAFWANGTYYELTLFMDLYNNEIVAYALSDKKGDPQTYHNALLEVLKKKEEYSEFKTVLHTDQGSVYCSKKFNESLPIYNIIHSMSRAGTPTDNGAMEAINGWAKDELFIDLHINESDDVPTQVREYIHFFNYERPSYVLKYETPNSFKEKNMVQLKYIKREQERKNVLAELYTLLNLLCE